MLAGDDPSEATLHVLDMQLNKREPLTFEEVGELLSIDTTVTPDMVAFCWSVVEKAFPNGLITYIPHGEQKVAKQLK